MGFDRLPARRIEQRWRHKTPGLDSNVDILPPSRTWEELSGKTTEELQAQYPRRYATYLDVLHGKRQMDTGVVRWLRMMNRLDRHITRERGMAGPTLQGDQLTVFEDIRQGYENGHTEGFIVLPTGVGKTVEFVELAEAFDSKTLVVVPTQDLVDQTVDEFKAFASGLSVGTYWQRSKDLTQQVTVTTYNSLLGMLRAGRLDPETIELLILDEAHKALGVEYSQAVSQFGSALKLGVTATDAFNEQKKLQQLLKNEFHRMGIREAIERSLLCDTACAVVKTNIDLSDVPIVDGRYDSEKLEAKYNTSALNQAAVDLYRTEHLGERAMAFCTGVTHAWSLAQKFRDNGIYAEAVWGEMDKQKRKKLIAEHKDRKGKLLILTNDKVLREGVNVPPASVCLNLDPTGSLIDATQRGGRITRIDRERRDKLGMVYDFLPLRDVRRPLVLFSDVLGGAVVLQRGSGDDHKGEARNQRSVRVSELDISGVRVIYDANEVMRVTQEYRGEEKKEATQEDVKAELLRQGVTAKAWLVMTHEQRRDTSVLGLKEVGLSTLFGIQSSARTNEEFERLCRAIWGDAEVDAAKFELEKEKLGKQGVINELAARGITAKEWLAIGAGKRRDITVLGLRVTALSALFGVEGQGRTNEEFERLCRAIWGDAEVDAAMKQLKGVESLKDITTDKVKIELVRQGVTLEHWLNMLTTDRAKISVLGLRVTALSALFGVEGQGRTNEEFERLCRAIWGDAEVDVFLKAKLEHMLTPQKIKETLERQGITASNWLLFSQDDRRKIEILGIKIGSIARLFGVVGNPVISSVFEQLCRAIWGDAEVDAAMKQLKGVESLKDITADRIREEIFKNIQAKDWLVFDIDGRRKIEVLGVKITRIGTLFGIVGNPIVSSVFEQLCRAIWGNAEVDAVLKDLRRK